MIFSTGDTHGSQSIRKLLSLKEYDLTYNDYLIILGDSGIVWHGNCKDKELFKWYEKNVSCRVLFVDGNHDNHVALNNINTEIWYGGKVHHINEQITHLMRGQIYTIDNKTFFTMGGGNSVDKQYRKEGVSWWKEEMPSDIEYEEGNVNLKMHDYKVDYLLTHECPERFLNDVIPVWARIQFGNVPPNRLNYYFNDLYEKVQFKKWYWGHYHTDTLVNEKCRCLYDDIIEIGR